MPYAYPKYPAAIFTDTDYPDVVDDVNWIKGWLVNALKEDLHAVLTELGISPRGSHTDVKARLDAIEWFLRTLIDYFEYATDELAQAAYVGDPYGSDILTSGTPSADTEHGAGYEADKACDNNETTRWSSNDTAMPHWWKYDLGEGVTKVVRKLRIRQYKAIDGQIKDFKLQGSNNDSDWDDIYTGQAANEDTWQDFTFTNTTTYRYYRVWITSSWYATAPNYASTWEFEMKEIILQCYSEATIKQQGAYSLKGIAEQTDSLNETLTRTVSPTIDLSGIDAIKFDIRASRTGSNIKIGVHDSGGSGGDITPNIITADIWQGVEWNISTVPDAEKATIDSIIITIVNADASNTFYIDNMRGVI